MPPMDFKSAGARVRSLIAAKKPQELSRSALTRDKLRDNVVQEGIDQSPRFQTLAEHTPTVEWEREHDDGSKTTEQYRWDTFGEAVRDIARAAYGWKEPEVLGRERVRPSHQFNREIVAKTMLTDEFSENRPYTRDNVPESLFGAQQFASKMSELAPEVAEHIARAEEMGEQEQQIDSAQDMIDELRAQAQQQANEPGGIDPDLAQRMKDAIGQREQAKGQLGQLLADHQASKASGAARKVAKAAAKAFEEGVEMANAISSLPGMEPGSAHNRTPAQQLELAEKLMAFRQLMKIARIVGRTRPNMRSKRQARSRDVQVEPVGITTGRELTRLLPHELARMQIPALRPLWLLDWSNQSLMEWKLGGKAPLEKGPAIIVTDGSGSMGGDRIMWAAATGLSVLGIMHGEKRDFAGVQFGSSTELKSWFFPASAEPDPDQVVDFATHFFGGGTSIRTGLREAKRIIDTVPAFDKADIIVISDGQDRFQAADRDLVAELDAMGVRIHGISIQCPGHSYLSQACEYVVDIEDMVLDGPNAATDALAENLT